MLFQVPVFAVQDAPDKEARYSFAVEFLNAVGVLPDFGELSGLDFDKNLTRGEFAEAMVKATGGKGSTSEKITFSDVPENHMKADYIAAAVSLGLMNGYGDGSFLPDYPVKYEEAIKVAVTALGYSIRADFGGGYPSGYLSEANRLSLLDNVSGKIGTFISIGDFAMLLVNTLNTEILETAAVSGDSVILNTNSDITLLNSALDIYSEAGRVTETERSALTGVTTLDKGTAIIGDKFYNSENSNVTDWLGYYVTAYYKDENNLLFVWPEKHQTLTVKAEDIISDHSEFSVTRFVYEDDSERIKEADISPYADLIYNGVSVGGFTKEDLAPVNGWVKLVDNNRDNVFDMVFVEEYRDIIVGTTDAKEFIIKNIKNSSDFVELNPEETDKYFFAIEENGKSADFGNIASGDVLSIFESKNKDGVKFIRVVISKNNFIGTLESKYVEDGKTTVVIGEKEYDISQYYTEHFSDLPVNTTGKYLTNFEGVLVGFGGNRERINSYGYLMKAGMDGGLSGKVQFKVLTERGEIEVFTASEKLNVDGTVYKGSSAQAELVNGSYLKQNGSYRQLVRYKTDEEGLINELDTVKNGARTNDELTEDFQAGERYYYAGSMGSDKFDFGINSSETAVFMVPKTEEYFEDEERYSGGIGSSFLREGNRYNISAYDADDDLIAGAVVIVQDISKDAGNARRAVIVDKISTVSDDSVKFTGFQSGKYITRYVEDPVLKARVLTFRKGDLITMTDDVNGRMVYARKLFTPTLNLRIDTYNPATAEPLDAGANGSITAGNNDNVIYFGSNADDLQDQFRGEYSALVRKNDSRIVFGGMNPDGTPNVDDVSKLSSMSIASNAVITIYSKADESVRVGLISDLDKYVYGRNPDARIFIHTYVGAVRDIFVFDLSE